MPNPLLVMSPQGQPIEPPRFKVGELVVRTWSKSKNPQYRIGKVTEVLQEIHGFGLHQYVVYRYSIQCGPDTESVSNGSSYFLSLDAHLKKLRDKANRTSRLLAKQYKEIEEAEELHAKGRKLFGV